jgi:hypothetical protein
MLRFVNVCLVLGIVALAYVIYQVKYEARALDEEIASLGKQIDEERDALAVLRANGACSTDLSASSASPRNI